MKPILTKEDVADLLACSVSTIYRRVESGDLPQPVRIGGLVRWRASDLRDALGIRDAA